MKSRYPNIKYLFEPRSIAIIGASQDTMKLGYTIIENILSGNYTGKVYPVNPKGGEILRHSVYKSVEEIDDIVDIACIAIPAKTVFEAVKSCAHKGVKFLVIITSGFSEIGNTAEERRITSYAREHGMRILGPNIVGIYSSSVSLNATFGPKEIETGNVAIITQSGAIGIAMIGKTKVEHIGISAIVSVGNKADIDEADLLEYLISHKETKIILLYIEGIRGGEKLARILKMATKKKPVIVIKSGRSKRGAIAAASHTGSLAGADEVFDAIIRQCGVIRAENIQEALEWCKFLVNSPVPKGENSVIITNGGGIGVLGADACEKYNVNLYDDIQTLKKTFSEVTPTFGSIRNPVDLTGQASLVDYDKALGAALKNRNIHSVICLGCETTFFNAEAFKGIVKKQYDDYKIKKPIVFSIFGGDKVESCIINLREYNIPIFSDTYKAVSCLSALYSHYRNKISPTDIIKEIDTDIHSIERIIKQARKDNRYFLLSYEAQDIMKAVGIPIPKSYVAHNISEAIKYAEEIGYPVVMKVVSKDIVHKSDVEGVALDLENKAEVIDAYEAILYNCRTNKPNALIQGMEVSEMMQSGIETIVGVRRDPSFGPIVMFGLGGIYVEVMKDIVFRSFPVGPKETMKMISELQSYPLLLGVRGEKKKDIDVVVDTVIKVGAILQKCKDISDIEVNPLVVYNCGEGVKALDVRILLSKPEEV